MSETVTPSTPLVAVDAQPTKDQVWTPSAAFLASWGQAVQMRTAWSTDVAQSVTAAEQRRGITGKPYRTLTVERQAFDPAEHANVQATFARMAESRSLVPLYQDAAHLTAATAAGGTVLTCDATNRRLYAGARILIAKPRGANQIPLWELAVVSAVASGSITVTAGVGRAYAAGDRVYPLLECQLALEASAAAETDYALLSTLPFREVAGKPGLPPLATPGIVPSGWPTYGGVPVFDVRTDWRSVTVGTSRLGDESSTGIDTYFELRGDRGRFTADLTFTALDRAAAFRLLRFFDYCGGRLFPFYFPSPMNTYRYLSGDGGAVVRVAVVGPLSDWRYVPLVAFRLRDGSYVVRKVTAYARASSTQDELTLDAAVPADLSATVAACGPAYLVRLDVDELTEQWTTDELMTTDLRVVELINERTFDIGVEPIDGVDTGGEWEDPEGGGTDDPPPLPTYTQLKRCDDDTDSGLYIPTDQITPDPIVLFNPADETCYHAASTDPTTEAPPDGSVLSRWATAADCTHAPCPTPCPRFKQITISGTTLGDDSFDGVYVVRGDGQRPSSGFADYGEVVSYPSLLGYHISLLWDATGGTWRVVIGNTLGSSFPFVAPLPPETPDGCAPNAVYSNTDGYEEVGGTATVEDYAP